MIRVLIADDHVMFRQGLINLLNTSEGIQIVAECGDGGNALAMIRDLEPDIAVLDIAMPVLDGISIVQSIVALRLATRAIILTMHDDSLVYSRAINSGARGFILKDDAYEELLDALRTVAAGGTAVSPTMQHAGIEIEPQTPDLTEREKQILGLIASGCTNRMIAGHLGISIKTVNNHRTNLMGKLNLHSTAELVRYSLLMGGL
ncbi:MAG: response regulator transcription factor [Desulfuromonadales bacterium]|nr:response regulator transcription factor [Desulfuromonadales bacterium]